MIKMFSIIRSYINKGLKYYLSIRGIVLFNYNNLKTPENIKAINLIKEIKREREMLLADQEAYLIYSMVKKSEKIEGDVAEVGVYKGGSAKLIREATQKPLHLFDNFDEGLPVPCEKDDIFKFKKRKYFSSFENVKNYLNGYSNIYFYKGFFPLTAESIKNKKFSFVHFDVDIYESTLDCLKFFYPRMSKGGIMISHDYCGSNGVEQAFDEFFKDKTEIIIEPFATGQCLIIKI